MSFQSLVGGLVIGLVLPFMFVAGIREYPAKTQNRFYSFLSIAYLFLMIFCWFREDVEYTVGLALAGALWLKLWYSAVKHTGTKERLTPLKKSNVEKLKESENSLTSQQTRNMDDSRLVRGALIVWVIVFLGTYLPWKDYAYFAFVRIVTALIALLMIEISSKISKPFWGGFILMIIIFNPIFPIKLDREIWQVVDISAILLLASFYFKVKDKFKKGDKGPVL